MGDAMSEDEQDREENKEVGDGFNFKQHSKDLVDQHWMYIKGLLEAAEGNRDLREIEFHYKTAFHHGLKHSIEIAEIYNVKWEDIK